MLNRFQDVFKSLHCRKVKYVVIGGIASVLHGVPKDAKAGVVVHDNGNVKVAWTAKVLRTVQTPNPLHAGVWDAGQ